MIIAFTATGDKWESKIDPRFGRTEFILIYNEEKDELNCMSNQDVIQMAHGAGPQTAQKIFEIKPQVLITGNGPGDNALNVLKQIPLKIITGAGDLTVREAYEKYKKGDYNA